MESRSSSNMTDEAFIAAFEGGSFGRTEFAHRSHLRMAWIYVRQLGVEGAIEKTTAGIRAMAEKHGQRNLYHDTLTRAWVYVVASAVAIGPPNIDFDSFMAMHPELLDKNLLLRYYSSERLSSPKARAHWLAPDVRAIPGAPDTDAEPLGDEPARIPEPVSRQDYLAALRRLPCSVAVLTARDAMRLRGTTVSSVVPISLESGLLLTGVKRDSRILDVVRSAARFGISYLSAEQRDVAQHFSASARPEGVAQFHGIPHMLGPFGTPIITGGPAWFECALHDEFAVGEYEILCGTVVANGGNESRVLQRLHGTWV